MSTLLVMRRAVRSIFPITFAVCCGVTLAQAPRDCHGPVDIEGALAKQPAAEAYNALGAWFARHSQVTCAIQAFRSAIRLRPDAWDGHFNLALALMDTREYKQAISEMQQANKLSPGRAPVHIALGMALRETRQLPAAEVELKAALSIDPRSVTALDHLAQVLTAQKRFSAAIRYLNQAVGIDPTDPNLRIALAATYAENGSNKQAIEVLV